MYSKIKIGRHPVHPMLVSFPVAFYVAALVCFIVYDQNDETFWFRVGLVANTAGVVMALLAAIPGFIDWLSIPSESKAKKTGLLHMVCNIAALILFVINFFLQRAKWNDDQPEIGSAIILSMAGVVFTLVAGFLGWKLVQTHHVGVGHLSHEEKVIAEAHGE